ncbi:hypothetical protein DIPPA_03447, partial [Diplonema papillatum]
MRELGFAGEVCPGCGAVVATRGEVEHHSAMAQGRGGGPGLGEHVRDVRPVMEAGLRAHARRGSRHSPRSTRPRSADDARGEGARGNTPSKRRGQWPRRSLQLQVGEREGRRDVAFLEAAEATEALAQMKEDKERRLALALAALAIKKDPPGPPGCDVLMGSQRPEADPPQPGEHKDPGSDAPMGEAQGPGPDLRRLSALGRSSASAAPPERTPNRKGKGGHTHRSATRSLGRGGDDLTVDGCVEPHPGPAAPPPPAPAAPPPVCLCGRLPGVQGRHRNMCPLSRAYRPDAAPAAPPANNHRRRAPAAGQAADPAAGPAHAAFEEEMPFSFAEISALAVPKLERIPLDAQLVVAAQLAKALQLAATGSVTGWLRLHSFATLVLFKPRRGGRKKVAAALRSRCHLWAHGRFGELWTEAQEVAAGRRQAGVPPVRFLVMDEDDNQIGRFVVIRKTKARWFGKAVAALSAAKANAEIDVSWGIVMKTLRALHEGRRPGP